MSRMTKEEIVAHFKNRPQKTEDYTDIYYEKMEVGVCDLTTDNRIYTVPDLVGELISDLIAEEKNSRLIPLGNDRIRAYQIKELHFRKGRFSELDKWCQKIILLDNPGLFAKWEGKFSPRLKQYLDGLLTEEDKRVFEEFLKNEKKN